MTQFFRLHGLIVVLALLVVAGCSDTAEISEYQVSKEQRQVVAFQPRAKPPTAATNNSNSSNNPSRMLALLIPRQNRVWFVKATGGIEEVEKIEDSFKQFASSLKFSDSKPRPSWTLPPNWKEAPNANSMRVATLMANDKIEVSVSFLPFSSSMNLDDYVLQNVNRWRAQLQLPNANLESVKKSITEIPVEGEKVMLVDLTGVSGGPRTPPFAANHPPVNHPPVGNPHAATPAAENSATEKPTADTTAANAPKGSGDNDSLKPSKDRLKGKVPENWEQGDLRTMRFAAYEVNQGDKKVEITVIPLGAAAGGLVDNVNRWRAQIGLEAANDEQIQKDVKALKVDGVDAEFVTLENDKTSKALYVVIAPTADKTWFIKMMGNSEIAETELQNFEAYAKSLDLP